MKLDKKSLWVPIASFLTFVSGYLVLGQSPYPENIIYYNLAPGVTNIAANTTNTVTGFGYALPDAHQGVRVYFSAITYTNQGFLNVYFQTSPNGGTLYDTPLNSSVKLTMWLTNSAAANGPVTNTVCDWFNLVGCTRLREARIENNSGTSVSNSQIVISYPANYSTQNR